MIRELTSGWVGAVALTAVHETARQFVPHAPRMDVLGTRAIRRPIAAAGRTPPKWRPSHRAALGLDLVSNSLFYALIGATGSPRHAVRRGLLFGLVAGLGAVFVAPLIGLGRSPRRRTPFTELMTVAWYTFGALTSAVVWKTWERE